MSRLLLIALIACNGKADDSADPLTETAATTGGTTTGGTTTGGTTTGGTTTGGTTTGGSTTGGTTPQEEVVEGDGASVTIPADANTSGAEVAVAQAEPPSDPKGYTWAGDVYALTPHGTTFAEPVTVSLPYVDTGETLELLKLDNDADTTWEPVADAVFDGGMVTFQTSSFSYYGPIAAGGGGTTGGGPDADGDGFSSADGDCDDSDPGIYPGATEYCNGLDEDCDGSVDEFAVDAGEWCSDADADGFGDPGTLLQSCSQPAGYVAECSDCDDADSSVGGGC